MQSRTLTLAILACLLLLAVPAAGQATPPGMQTQWRTSVPFEFYVGDTLLPAGDYTVLSDPANGLLVIRNEATGHIVLRFTKNIDLAEPVAKTEWTFVTTGGKHVLHQLWMAGDLHGHDVLHGQEVPEPPQK